MHTFQKYISADSAWPGETATKFVCYMDANFTETACPHLSMKTVFPGMEISIR